MILKRFFQTLRLGVYSLLLHKLRSGLAVLGILIGITAVIWLVAMGEGVSYQAQQQIKDLGATNIIVRSVRPAQQGSSASSGLFLEYGLLREDFDLIVSNIRRATTDVLEQIVPLREIKKEARHHDLNLDVRVVGCTPEYLDLNHLTIDRGRFLTDSDNSPPENIAVLAADAAKSLFPLKNPINQTIQIDADFYRIVGVTEDRDPTAAIGGSLDSQDYNLDVYIPLETLRTRIGDMIFTSRSGSREGEIVQLSQITIGLKELTYVDAISEIVRKIVLEKHPNKDVKVIVPKELLRQAALLRMMFNVLLILIAGISLVVGGIGIMNIMLATVTERTREIGIRRALGAKRRNIIAQFLVESVVLTGIGGGLGVACGFLCKPTINFARDLVIDISPETANTLPTTILELQPIIAPWSIVASLLISVGVGLIFGMYPAYRAANMDPIEALRHE